MAPRYLLNISAKAVSINFTVEEGRSLGEKGREVEEERAESRIPEVVETREKLKKKGFKSNCTKRLEVLRKGVGAL